MLCPGDKGVQISWNELLGCVYLKKKKMKTNWVCKPLRRRIRRCTGLVNSTTNPASGEEDRLSSTPRIPGDQFCPSIREIFSVLLIIFANPRKKKNSHKGAAGQITWVDDTDDDDDVKYVAVWMSLFLRAAAQDWDSKSSSPGSSECCGGGGDGYGQSYFMACSCLLSCCCCLCLTQR